ncbi:hypothetical protein B0H16DRAFT_1479015 [Mycena metata]|uniref:Uncharacterized protein n=1 Tax=Mycena metata TaxID=1033252 RepID=A0AAD7ME77_9AGAR|nr:hypothetical protein B0H16DRAFT_1479015 [Mycena metata]
MELEVYLTFPPLQSLHNGSQRRRNQQKQQRRNELPEMLPIWFYRSLGTRLIRIANASTLQRLLRKRYPICDAERIRDTLTVEPKGEGGTLWTSRLGLSSSPLAPEHTGNLGALRLSLCATHGPPPGHALGQAKGGADDSGRLAYPSRAFLASGGRIPRMIPSLVQSSSLEEAPHAEREFRIVEMNVHPLRNVPAHAHRPARLSPPRIHDRWGVERIDGVDGEDAHIYGNPLHSGRGSADALDCSASRAERSGSWVLYFLVHANSHARRLESQSAGAQSAFLRSASGPARARTQRQHERQSEAARRAIIVDRGGRMVRRCGRPRFFARGSRSRGQDRRQRERTTSSRRVVGGASVGVGAGYSSGLRTPVGSVASLLGLSLQLGISGMGSTGKGARQLRCLRRWQWERRGGG